MSEIPLLNRESARRVLDIPVAPSVLMVLALMLTFGLVIVMLSLLVSFRLGETMARPNPFSAYESLWPGQSIADMVEFGVHMPKSYTRCYTESYSAQYPGEKVTVTYGATQPPENMTCANSVDNDLFRFMGIRIKENQIQEIDLFSDVLQEDTLYLYWGAPDSITEGQVGRTVYLHWDRTTYTATATLIKPYSVVNLVTLVAK
ncbi:MAG: hypothetical protein ABI690_00115 [Chloroflexota bacterium]